MDARFHTIGHSNRGLEEFLGMLRSAQIDMVIDVRAFPRSRTNPVFNIDHLPARLSPIGYRHWPAFGGRRPKQAQVDEKLNALWRVQSFHNYADHALGAEFGDAFDGLLALGRDHRLALMCAEAVWWRCHRRIIADYLLLNGQPVIHLMAPGHSDNATPTPGACRTGQGKIIYPRPDRR